MNKYGDQDMETPSLSVNLKHKGGSVVLGKTRNHKVMIDRPKVKGGNDEGPMGGEFLLFGLGGCFFSTLLGAYKADYDDYPDEPIEIMVGGTLVSGPARFSTFAISVYASFRLKEKLAKALLKAERGCIVHNTLKSVAPVSFQYNWVDPQVFPSLITA
jgi:putative redox protein